MAILAFFANLFGIKCNKINPPDPTTITEPTEPSSEPTDPAAREYTVLFKDDRGVTLLALTLPAGEIPVYTGATPEKAATAKYT